MFNWFIIFLTFLDWYAFYSYIICTIRLYFRWRDKTDNDDCSRCRYCTNDTYFACRFQASWTSTEVWERKSWTKRLRLFTLDVGSLENQSESSLWRGKCQYFSLFQVHLIDMWLYELFTWLIFLLIFSQREVADILLREQLEEWRSAYSDIFSVLYCVGEKSCSLILSNIVTGDGAFAAPTTLAETSWPHSKSVWTIVIWANT